MRRSGHVAHIEGKRNETVGACGTHGGEEKCVNEFCRRT